MKPKERRDDFIKELESFQKAFPDKAYIVQDIIDRNKKESTK